MQHITTLLGTTCCARLATLLYVLRHVATCCDMLNVVGSNLKMVKFFMQHLWMLHDVVVVWQVQQCCAFACTLVQFSTCNMLQQGGQTHAICCSQQCCNLFCSNVAIVWPELANVGPTMLEYVALRCCDRLARDLNEQDSVHQAHVQSLSIFRTDLLVAPPETELLMLVRPILQAGIPLLVSLTVCVGLCSNNIKGP